MQVGSVKSNFSKPVQFVNFRGTTEPLKAEKKDEFKNSQPKAEKPKSSVTKKIGIGVISALYPGLGQFANGQWLKAIGFAIGIPAVATAGFMVLGFPGLLAGTLLHLYNIYDAAKNA